ncbi:MAG: Tripartite DNA replication factor [Sclerophora amabilis]|nr:MAG: Tripartite DNA replication factor [Sclerophora amabilis]
MDTPAQFRPTAPMSPICAFADFTEYLTFNGYAVVQEMELVRALNNKMRAEPVDMKIMRLPGAGDRLYLAFLSSESVTDGLRLKPKTALKVSFDTQDQRLVSFKNSWDAVVIDSLPLTPNGVVTIQLLRKRNVDENLNVIYDDRAIEAGDFRHANNEAARDNYEKLPVTRTRVEVVYSDKTFRQYLACLEKIRLDQASSKPQMSSWVSTLLGQSTEVKTTTDLYEGIPDINVTRKSMPVTESQSKVIDYVCKIPNRLAVIQGPPGTGKTYTVVEMILPLLMSTDQKILMVSTSNIPVDDFVLKLTSRLKIAQSSDKVVVRLHAVDADEEVVIAAASKDQGPWEEPRIDDTQAMQEIGELLTARFIYDHLKHSTSTPHVSDPRVVLRDHSLGVWMLKVAGVIPSKWANREAWSKFRDVFRQFDRIESNQSWPEQDNANIFRQLMGRLRQHIFEERAYVVAGTISAVCVGSTYKAYSPDFIIVDECARASELDFVNLIASYPKTKAIIAIGDHRQHLPLVTSKKLNNLASQLGLAMSTRLLQLGHRSALITEQHRMVEGTGSMASRLFYQGLLSDSSSTHISRRPNAAMMQRFLHTQFNMPANSPPHIFLSIENSSVVQHNKGTRSNLYNVGAVLNLLPALIKETSIPPQDIWIITPYLGQVNTYKAVLRDLSSQGYDKIKVRTVDGAQDAEGSVVIVDLVFRDDPGFVKDPNRLNVAITRHRDALILVGHLNSLFSSKKQSHNVLREIGLSFAHARKVHFVKTERLANHGAILETIKANAEMTAEVADKKLATEDGTDRRCHQCGKIGHSAAECPDSVNKSHHTCPNCGHISRDYPEIYQLL